MFLGSVRKEGEYKVGRCSDVAVSLSEPLAVVAALCGTHQELPGSEAEVDSLGSYLGGPRFRKRFGKLITAFAEGLAGVETGFRHGGFHSNAGFSVGAGGGVDVGLKKWLTLRAIHVTYQNTWINHGTVDAVRIRSGIVLRFGRM